MRKKGMLGRLAASACALLLTVTTAVGSATIPTEAAIKLLNEDAVAKLIGNSNPVVDYQFCADPFAVVYDGRVYLYMSSDEIMYESEGVIKANDYSCLNKVRVISSDDMVNWTDHGSVRVAASKGEIMLPVANWAVGSWAPTAAYKQIDGKDKFFLYFANGTGGIGVLEADSPIGPFRDVLGHALIDRDQNNPQAAEGVEWLFDPAVFVDDDGSAYLYYGGGVPGGDEASQETQDHPMTARVVKLGDDMVSIEGEAAVIDAPGLFEDSGIHKFGDKYYYSYCTNYKHKVKGLGNGTIACMVSDSPMGPFTDATKIFNNPNSYFQTFSNNHHAIFEFNDTWYMAYHAQTLGKAMGMDLGYRSTHINALTINEDGSIESMKADYEGIAQLKSLDPYQVTEAETIAWQDGIAMEECKEDSATGLSTNYAVGSIDKNDWISVSGADFGAEGAKRFTVKADPGAGGIIEIYLDGPKGTLVGSVEVSGDEKGYQEFTCSVDGLTGTQNVFFVFRSLEDSDVTDALMVLDNWQFGTEAYGTAAEGEKSSGFPVVPVVIASVVAEILILVVIVMVLVKRKKKAVAAEGAKVEENVAPETDAEEPVSTEEKTDVEENTEE